MIIDLDTEASRDPDRAGSKAAWLARGQGAGLPVLPGFVVEAAESRFHMSLGAATLAKRGSGGARLAIMEQTLPLADELVDAGARVGPAVVARSSTALESSGEWSGAFTSYVGLVPPELPRAVVGCWASAFSVAALGRLEAAGLEPGSFPMAVVVQRALAPAAGGTARIDDDGAVTVNAVKG
ncbi:MAG: PEP/pyruvate-binding domain-containing protein, partial [Acidimicrobiia bacterium]